MRTTIERYCRDIAAVLHAMPCELLEEMAELLLDCQRRGKTIFVLGNGGSAATASHFACDLMKGTRVEGVPDFRVIALTDNVPLLTAWANDTRYEQIFVGQLAALLQPGDLVIAISTSGRSPNVLAAAATARQLGATVVALTGSDGAMLRELANLTIGVPSNATGPIEDMHMVVVHSLCTALVERLRMVLV